MSKVGIYWFRKALRLHDNDSLLKASSECQTLYPIFFLDPAFTTTTTEQKTDPSTIIHGTGINKPNANVFHFFFETLSDLNNSLNKQYNTQLFIIRGKPQKLFKLLFNKLNITNLYFEIDTEPYSKIRDNKIIEICNKLNINIYLTSGHTLYDTKYILSKSNNIAPKTYTSFLKILDKCGNPEMPKDKPNKIPLCDVNKMMGLVNDISKESGMDQYKFNVPRINEIGYNSNDVGDIPVIGGESNALVNLEKYVKDKEKVCQFSKPMTSPNSLLPSTTLLSPYVTNGSLSIRMFWHKINDVYKGKSHTKPPVSLHGQMYFREWFYLLSSITPNFHQMKNNEICRQIEWDNDQTKIEKWKMGETGFPFIDALMIQLRTTGWIHHLGRHAVACFLTRGDLWQHWEAGRDIFNLYLIDGDYALNSANWMWLSASAFFNAYFRVYSPISFGKKTDPNGEFIKKYIPKLKNYPKKYIYEPWTASISDQKKWGCIIGKDYPKPICNHDNAKKENLTKMKNAFDKIKQNKANGKRTMDDYYKPNKKKRKV